MVVKTYNSSIWELEAKRSGDQRHPWLYIELAVNPGYMRSESHMMEGQNQLPASCPLIFTGTPRQISPHLTHELCKTISKILIES